jgi:hypothetical protein
LGGSLLATQLRELGAMHTHVASTSLCQALAAAVPTLYAALSALDANQLEVAAELLRDAPSVWVGNGFQPPSRVSRGIRVFLSNTSDYRSLNSNFSSFASIGIRLVPCFVSGGVARLWGWHTYSSRYHAFKCNGDYGTVMFMKSVTTSFSWQT